MNEIYSEAVESAQKYYNSDDADNFYFHVWGGEDIHIGLYDHAKESIAAASERTVDALIAQCQMTTAQQGRVLDMGAGYGGAARKLVEKLDCHVTCLNLSEVQNVRNRTMNIEQGLSDRITVIDGNFESIPSPDSTYDLVWSQDAILHSGKRAQVLAEVNRTLKPGGEFIFTDPMQINHCPAAVLQPVLKRIHLDTLGSFDFYRQQAKILGWQELGVFDHTGQLVTHYTRVHEELLNRRELLTGKVSEAYIDHMLQGLAHWIDAGNRGYLAWGILHFQKPI